ncbi:MAG: ATP-binding protein [Pseudomonadales bacterium]
MKYAIGCFVWFVTWLLITPAYAGITIDTLTKPVSIAGEWQFHSGDDLRWAAPDLDDSAWHKATVPAHSPPVPVSDDGLGWYRLALQLDLDSSVAKNNVGTLAVSLGNVMSAYELYAGGVKIGGAGRLPPDPRSVYDRHLTLEIPASAVDDSGRLVLALRVWRDPAWGPEWATGPYLGSFIVGNVGDLRASAVRSAILPDMILAALYFVLGWYHLLIARRNPVLREFFWFGCFSIALGLYSLEFSQSRFFLDLPYWLHKKIEFLSLYLLPVLLTQTLFIVTRTPLNRLFRGFYVVFIVLFAAVALVPNMFINALTLKTFQYTGAVWSICFAGIISWRAWQGVRSARIIFGLLLLLVAAVFNDVMMSAPWIESRQATQYAGGFLLIFIALLMAERYTDVLKRLEMSVEKRTAELVTTNLELEAAVATKGNFLANMSHEMRTPMNAILGLTHLGLKTELTDQQRDYFTKVEQSAEGLQGIINSILDFTKLEDGELECASEPFTPGDLVTGLVRIWDQPVAQAGLQLDVVIGDGLPAALSGDEARLKQVLGNFISNAIKFTQRGKIGLLVELVEMNPESAKIRFAVSDTGMGIAQEQREHLFEAFSQADNSMTRDFGGAGLGLAIARRLVAKMGGEISLQSAVNEGSIFSFELDLPLADVADVALAEEPEQIDEADIDLGPIRGARILLVDDSDINLQVAGELLTQAKLYVDVAHDGREAVAMVLAGDYECVLMDVQMPVMDGYTATEKIRSETRFSQLPILAMTANAMPQDRARGAQAGMDTYIPKPIEPSDLYRALLKWIPAGERDYAEGLPDVSAGKLLDLAHLPDAVPGLHIAEGMKRVGGNTELYLKLLQDMCNGYAETAADIQSLLDAGHPDDARQLSHKLRGIANNLGAIEIGACAEAIELSLKSDMAVDQDALQALAEALAVVLKSQSGLAPLMVSNAAAADFSSEELSALFVELLQAVVDSNPEALDIAAKLVAGVGEGGVGYTQLVAAHDALDCFDFAGAQELLQSVAEAFAGGINPL